MSSPGGHCSCLGALAAPHGSSRASSLVPYYSPSLPGGHGPCIGLFDGAVRGLKAGMPEGSRSGPQSTQREPALGEIGKIASQLSIELGCCREAWEPGALPEVSVMPDLSCHQQAIISALRDRGRDARTQISSCLPSRLLFPIALATAPQAAVSFHWPEGAGKAAPRDAGCGPQYPSRVTDGALCPAPASAGTDSWHGERNGGRAASACAASLSPLRLPAVFHGIVSESRLSGGSMGHLRVRLLPAGLHSEKDAKHPDTGRSRNTWQGTVSIY